MKKASKTEKSGLMVSKFRMTNSFKPLIVSGVLSENPSERLQKVFLASKDR